MGGAVNWRDEFMKSSLGDVDAAPADPKKRRKKKAQNRIKTHRTKQNKNMVWTIFRRSCAGFLC